MAVVSTRPARRLTLRRLLLTVAFSCIILYFRKDYVTAVREGLSDLDPVERGDSSTPSLNSTSEDSMLAFNSSKEPLLQSSIPLCRTLPGAEDVLVVVKTGATEVFARIPEQLLTLSRCIPHLMVFSDLEQDLGGFHIYDALVDVSEKYKDTHEDFELYHQLQRYHAGHRDLSELSSGKGWNLDKWKNIPMLHRVYEQNPDMKWFVFIDADTYLAWSNLLQLLSRLDSDEPLYIGASYFMGSTTFAQGGTGYVISNAAAKKFEEIHSAGYIAKWELQTSTNCCGDVMLAIALLDAGVHLEPAWPMLNPELPSKLDWSERFWCWPMVTNHHVLSYEVEALWHFEQEWINNTVGQGKIPVLYKDVFGFFIQPWLSTSRDDWNNLSRDDTFTEPSEEHVEEDEGWERLSEEEKQTMWDSRSDIQRQSVRAPGDCHAACEAEEDCKQWLFRPGSCNLNRAVRLGRAADPSDNATSGWMLDRIEQFKWKQEPCVPAWGFAT